MRLRYRHWTRGEGIEGKIKKEEDFVVRETIDQKFLKRFRRTAKGVSHVSGKYHMFLLKKKGMTTPEAIEKLSRELKILKEDFGYAGLKDKFSISYQYMTVKTRIKPLKMRNLEISEIRRIDRPIHPGNLIGNEFMITLHCCKNPSRIFKVIEELKRRGIPNYFGEQRFGKNKTNHIIGKFLIKRKFKKALKLINKNCKRDYRDIREVPKKLLKFFLHSYQSFIFNETLNKYMEKNNEAFFSTVLVIGYDTELRKNKIENIIRDIIRKEDTRPEDFRIQELKLSCRGSERNLFIKIREIDCKIRKNVGLRFFLPKGSYATVLLREICK